jgi:hypothetical protein
MDDELMRTLRALIQGAIDQANSDGFRSGFVEGQLSGHAQGVADEREERRRVGQPTAINSVPEYSKC